MPLNKNPITVCALYQFVALPDYAALQQPLIKAMRRLKVHGTVLLAEEGINGTIAGAESAVLELIKWLRQQAQLTDLEIKTSRAAAMPFKRGKVKLKKEIVTMGVAGIDPRHSNGTYVAPQAWNHLLDDPEVTLIDCRNDYEIAVGTFAGAVNPGTSNFRALPNYLTQTLRLDKHKKIAMFCTGGIRCEKSTAYLKQQGFAAVYHLKGGILKYLAEVPEAQTKWQGECFVFDERVTLDHQLQKGSYDQCHACRMPITEADKQRADYTLGVSCHHCYHNSSAAQKTAFAQRQKQIALAKQRGEAHIGAAAAAHAAQNKMRKQQQLAANQQANKGADKQADNSERAGQAVLNDQL